MFSDNSSQIDTGVVYIDDYDNTQTRSIKYDEGCISSRPINLFDMEKIMKHATRETTNDDVVPNEIIILCNNPERIKFIKELYPKLLRVKKWKLKSHQKCLTYGCYLVDEETRFAWYNAYSQWLKTKVS